MFQENAHRLARLRFLNQDGGGGEGGPSYLDEFKLKKQCEIVIRSLRHCRVPTQLSLELLGPHI